MDLAAPLDLVAEPPDLEGHLVGRLAVVDQQLERHLVDLAGLVEFVEGIERSPLKKQNSCGS